MNDKDILIFRLDNCWTLKLFGEKSKYKGESFKNKA